MELLKLTFENLNSLVGKWEIDFTCPEYRREGIFAITGPTGAGKSTILDAICLALYSSTPRLGRVTKGENEIMSQQTGHCFAEVTFRTKDGVFRSSFYQNRAKKKAGGKLQDPKRSFSKITDEETAEGEELSRTNNDVEALVTAHVGLDFTQFTRAVMLAQGKFAEFLQASGGDRGTILEKLTKTEIYSEISMAVHSRQKKEAETLRCLEAGMKEIRFLTPEEMAECETRQKTLETECAALNETLKTLDAQLAWREKIAELEKTRAQLEAEWKKLTAEEEAFSPLDEKLKKSESAAKIQGPFQEFRRAQETQTGLEAEHQAALKKREAAENQVSVTTEALLATQTKLMETAADAQLAETVPAMQHLLKDYTAQLEPLFRKQKKLSEMAESLEAVKTQRLRAEEEVQRKHQESGEAGEQKTELEKSLKTLLDGHEAVKIREELDAAQETGRVLEHLEKDLTDFSRHLEQRMNVAEDIRGLTKKREELIDTVRLAEEKVIHQMELLQTLERKLYLEAAVANLQQLREMLHPGDACPLCGGTVHVQAAEPCAADTAGTQKEKMTAEKTLAQWRKEAEMQRQELRLTELRHLQKSEAWDENLRTLEAHIASLRKAYETLGEAFFIQDLQEFPVTDEDARWVNVTLEDEKKRVCQTRELLAAKTDALKETLQNAHAKEREIAAAQTRVEACRSAWLAALELLNRKKNEETEVVALRTAAAQNLETDILNLKRCRNEMMELTKAFLGESPSAPEWMSPGEDIFSVTDVAEKEHAETSASAVGDENAYWANAMETLLRRAASRHALECALKELEKKLAEQKAGMKAAEENLETLTQKITAAQLTLDSARQVWETALGDSGFLTEKAFLDARLAEDTQKQLVAQRENLYITKISLTAQHDGNETALHAERKKNLTPENADVLLPEKNRQKNHLEEKLREQGDLREKMRKSGEQEAYFGKENVKRELQRAEVTRWSLLDELIGSANGQVFKKFAQGLTFAELLRHANRHLCQITPRYELHPKEKSEPGADEKNVEMEITVRDHDHGGVIRSAKNLSGGETFLVSLALALGLASMAGKEVRLDSLFLDEGFGTLDEETLDITLFALGALQQSGKLIGVISHVPALQERLSTRIAVQRVAAGRSELTGPGVTRKNEK